ncbi:MAG: hypothetical protein D3916_15840, partial [Candidatus Electrothrix sp. MAN1_4]|nr:hypothetical protein [Candidatus Electrothrix sp. MAN1_4]
TTAGSRLNFLRVVRALVGSDNAYQGNLAVREVSIGDAVVLINSHVGDTSGTVVLQLVVERCTEGGSTGEEKKNDCQEVQKGFRAHVQLFIEGII